MQRRERIVGNFRLRRRNRADQRRFAGIRQAEQADVRHHLQLEPQLRASRPADPGIAWRGVRLVLLLNLVLPQPPLPPLATSRRWPKPIDVAQLLFGIDIDDNGADRDGNVEIVAAARRCSPGRRPAVPFGARKVR